MSNSEITLPKFMHIGVVGNRIVGNYLIPRAGQPANSASGSDSLIGLSRYHTKRTVVPKALCRPFFNNMVNPYSLPDKG